MPGVEVGASTDAELHLRIIAGEIGAAVTWQERHQPAVMAMLLKRGHSLDDAEELWNETFEAVLRAAPRLEPRGESLRAYAFRVAQKRSARRFARLQKELETVPLLDVDQRRDEPPAPWQPLSPRARAMRDCIERAPDRVRAVAEVLLAGGSRRELASTFKVSLDGAYKIVERAKGWLRDCVEAAFRTDAPASPLGGG